MAFVPKPNITAARTPFVPTHVASNVRSSAMAGHVAADTQKHVSKEEKNAQRAEKLRGATQALWSAELLLIPSFLLRKAGLHKLSAPFRAVGHTFRWATQQVTFNDFAKLPGHMARTAGDQFKITGYSQKTVGKFTGFAAGADRFMRGVNDRFLTPLNGFLGGAIDRVTEGKSGGFFSKGLNKFAGWRGAANQKKAVTLAGEILSVKNFEKLAENHSGLGELHRMASANMEGMSAVAKKTHFDKMAETASKLFESHTATDYVAKGASYDIAQISKEVSHMATKGAGIAEAAIAHEGAVGKNLQPLVKNAISYIGRTPILTGVLALGAVAAGVGAYWTAKHANNEGDKSLNKMIDYVGDKNAPYIKELKLLNNKNHHQQWAKAAVDTVSEGLFAVTADTVGMGGPAMFGMMTLPMLGPLIVKENPGLNAFAQREKFEAGEINLTIKEVEDANRYLVSSVPDVAAHGGYYAKLTPIVAHHLTEMNIPLRETMQILADAEKFTALAVEAKQKYEAHQAELKAHPEATAAQTTEVSTEKVAEKVAAPTHGKEHTHSHVAAIGSTAATAQHAEKPESVHSKDNVADHPLKNNITHHPATQEPIVAANHNHPGQAHSHIAAGKPHTVNLKEAVHEGQLAENPKLQAAQNA